MTPEAASLALQAHFGANVDVPVFYANQAGTPDLSVEVWVRMVVLLGDAEQADFGVPRRYRTLGILTVQIFVLKGIGDGAAKALAETIKPLYRSCVVSDCVFSTPRVEVVPTNDDSPWYQMNVLCPFHHDEVTA